MALQDYLGEQLLGVLASYQPQGIVHHIAVVYPRRNDRLQLFIPKGHALVVGSLVTLHLDNRTGVDELDAELRVYRASYKGRVVGIDESWAAVEPVEFMLIHGTRAVEEYRAPGYAFPTDPRPQAGLPLTPLQRLTPVEEKDHHNKVGVLTTLAEGQALMRDLRGRVSGLCQPTYVLDIPGGYGKSPVGPAYVTEDGVTDPQGRLHAYPPVG